MDETKEFQERIGRIDGLVQKLESSPDPALRRTARQLIESLMEIHGAGLERILTIVSDAGATGAVLVSSLANDPLVSSLLVLYGLHPDDFETRVRRALENARLLLRPEGAHLEGIEIGENTVRLKIVGAAWHRLEAVVREALLETAPDATEVVIGGGGSSEPASGFVPLASLRAVDGSPVAAASLTRP